MVDRLAQGEKIFGRAIGGTGAQVVEICGGRQRRMEEFEYRWIFVFAFYIYDFGLLGVICTLGVEYV